MSSEAPATGGGEAVDLVGRYVASLAADWQAGCRAALLSLDDLYLSREALGRGIHPLLRTAVFPGRMTWRWASGFSMVIG